MLSTVLVLFSVCTHLRSISELVELSERHSTELRPEGGITLSRSSQLFGLHSSAVQHGRTFIESFFTGERSPSSREPQLLPIEARSLKYEGGCTPPRSDAMEESSSNSTIFRGFKCLFGKLRRRTGGVPFSAVDDSVCSISLLLPELPREVVFTGDSACDPAEYRIRFNSMPI